ncbi:MAG TPA: hypothetical protein EYP53_02915 [Candidatus Latescibacteria bacterium]|nr:hypothetical protein [Candidatus Latescibacterota bacterium]
MQRKKYGLLAIASCGILLLWAGSLLAQKGRPFQEVFPNAKVDWKLELPHPKGRIVGCDDGFVFVSDDRMHLYRFSAEGRKLWELRDIKRFPSGGGCWYGGIRGARVSQDGRFVYVLRDAGQATKPWKEYTHEQLLGLSRPYGEYLDADGNRLWEREEPPLLSKISPQGKYLMTEFDAMSERQELVVVSGKDGSILWRREGEIGIWGAEFVTDERIAYYKHPTLYLFDSSSGNAIWELDMRPYFKGSGFESIAYPQITASKDGNRIVLFGDYALGKSAVISLDSQGNILWSRADLGICSANVSESGNTVFVDGNRSCRLIDNKDGTDLWIKQIRLPGTLLNLHVKDEIILFSDRFGGTVFELSETGSVKRISQFNEMVIPVPMKNLNIKFAAILVQFSKNTVGFSYVTFRREGR